MNHTILLTKNDSYISAKTNRIMSIIGGLLFVSLGILQFYRYQNEYLILFILQSISGLYFIMYGYLGQSKKSKYAPKVLLTNEFILIKKSIWKPAKHLNWSDIKSIQYGSYQIDFQLTKEAYTFTYNTTSSTSLEIKRAIREFAENKSIEVNGG